jgi:hypothetical protein
MEAVHSERVAWEGARAFVAAADADVYWWLSDMVGRYLGTMYQLDLAETHRRLQREDAWFAEVAAWRVRLEDLLRRRPGLEPVLSRLVAETSSRMGR